jgi:hypothetical protein
MCLFYDMLQEEEKKERKEKKSLITETSNNESEFARTTWTEMEICKGIDKCV